MNEFEKWFKIYLQDNYLVECDFGQLNLPKSIARQCAEAAYLAGAAAMRERCAEVADNEANGFRNTRIAAAIRKIEVE